MHASSSNPNVRRANAAGFTLIELLGVVGIIAILLGIVLSAIETVHRYSRKAVAQTEVRTISDAWKRYYDHYNRWPGDTTVSGYLATPLSTDDYHTYRIDAAVGKALEGRIQGDAAATALNPDGIHFVEFTRYADDADGNPVPVNPWFRRGVRLSETATDSAISEGNRRFYYYVRFDVNANNQVATENIPGLADEAKGPEGRIARSVIVWTYSPDESATENAITSWTR